MQNAKQIAEIVQSEHIWNFFARSKLFTHAVPNEAVLNQARLLFARPLGNGRAEPRLNSLVFVRVNVGSGSHPGSKISAIHREDHAVQVRWEIPG